MNDQQWEAIAAGLREEADRMHQAREAGLSACRKLIQASARSIRHVHRRQFADADRLLLEARSIAAEARGALGPYPSLVYAGFLHDAEKEMVEAAAVLAIVHNRNLPRPDELEVMPMSYLNGMGEAASECRRFVLDELRRGAIAEAETILQRMESIYDELISFDYSDGMTGGLRRTCDALRAVVERTRSDLATTAMQTELVRELREVRRSLPPETGPG
jgi:translin